MPNTGDPQIKETRLAQADEHANKMDDAADQQPLETLEDEEQLDRNDRVDDEITVGDTGEHLRTGQRCEQRVATEFFGHCSFPRYAFVNSM